MSRLFDKTTDALAAAIHMRNMKHNVISSNIANAETPGFAAKKLDFESALARALDIDGKGAMSTSHPNHMALGGNPVGRVVADIYENPEGATNNDRNTVDLEKEMSALAENTIMQRAALQLINKKLAALRYAATEGR